MRSAVAPFFLIAGPCVIESDDAHPGDRRPAEGDHRASEGPVHLQGLLRQGQPLLARKSSAARASRPASRCSTTCASRSACRCSPTCTRTRRCDEVAAVVDVLQTPAFLCRQTNFIVDVASQGKPVNIKKGQFLSPWEMQNVVDKARSTGNDADHGVRARLLLRLQQSGLRHALAGDHARHRLPRWCSMPRTRCSCPAGRATPPAASASSCRCWRAPRSPPASPAFSWKRIRILPRRSRTGRTPGRWTAWKPCSSALVELDRAVKKHHESFSRNPLL